MGARGAPSGGRTRISTITAFTRLIWHSTAMLSLEREPELDRLPLPSGLPGLEVPRGGIEPPLRPLISLSFILSLRSLRTPALSPGGLWGYASR